MLGAAHALANPLTAVHDVVHGQAVAMMLPHVVRFNAVSDDSPYAELVAALPDGTMAAGHRAGERLATWLEGVVAAGGLAPSLTAAGISAPDLGFLAAAAASQWTAGFNPRPVAVDDLAKLYQEAR
jgi:alcohol dehydrogenase